MWENNLTLDWLFICTRCCPGFYKAKTVDSSLNMRMVSTCAHRVDPTRVLVKSGSFSLCHFCSNDHWERSAINTYDKLISILRLYVCLWSKFSQKNIGLVSPLLKSNIFFHSHFWGWCFWGKLFLNVCAFFTWKRLFASGLTSRCMPYWRYMVYYYTLSDSKFKGLSETPQLLIIMQRVVVYRWSSVSVLIYTSPVLVLFIRCQFWWGATGRAAPYQTPHQ